MGSSFGQLFRIHTWGESHGGAVGVVVDGCPPRIPLAHEAIQEDLDRRRPGQSHLTTPRQEEDRAEILSGVFEGLTLGTPILILVPHPAGASPYAGPCVVGIDYDDIGEGRTARLCYELDVGGVAVLWCETGEARPSFRRKVDRDGETLWIAEEDGRRMVAFLDERTQLLCCVVGDQSEDDLVTVAQGLRDGGH